MQTSRFLVLIAILNSFGVLADTCDFVDLAVSQFTSCGTLTDGTVQCWGNSIVNLPTTPLKSIVGGNSFFCGLKSDNTAYCWGDIGPTPTDTFTMIDAGYFAACGLKADGSITCWGNITAINYNIPSGKYIYIDVGYNSACAINTSNSLVCWGNSVVTSNAVPTGNDFVQVSSNVYYACALRTSGNVSCWASYPAIPSFFFDSIVVGEHYTCGITKDTSILKCWGSSNDFYMLPREQEVVSITVSTDWGNFCVMFKNQSIQCERGTLPTNCTHIGTSTTTTTSSSVATSSTSTTGSPVSSSSTSSSVATSSVATSSVSTSSVATSSSTSATSTVATSSSSSTSSSTTSSSTTSSITTGTSSTTGTQNYTKIVVPLDGNVTVTYPSGDSSTVNITIPFVLDNSTAEIVEADPTNPVYVNPDGETAPGQFKGSSFFITIYDKSGKEVHSNFSEPIKVVLEGTFGPNDNLYYFDVDLLVWVVATESCPSDRQLFSIVNGVMTVNICHLTQFAVFAPHDGTSSSGAAAVSSSVAISLFALSMVL